jgi:hypothetical protein
METGKPQRLSSVRLSYAMDCAIIFFIATALIFPLFSLSYSTNWPSIESTFISDARFLVGHWPHPTWQPLWYGGTRWDYIYPPALRYGTAIVAMLFSTDTVTGYHGYTALLYALGIVGVYVLARAGSGSRMDGWLSAIAAALISPTYLFMSEMRHDAPHLLPQRLRVLVLWGEGPHVSSLSLLGFALAASYRALQKYRPFALAAAAVCCALVVSHNFYGATSLAIFFPLLVWAVWITHQDHWAWIRAAGIAGLAYGLTAFWLVPSYFRITTDNLKLVAQPGNSWSAIVAVVVLVLFLVISATAARQQPERAYPVFIWGSLVFFSLNVAGFYFFGFRVTGEPMRLIPELDLVIILAAAMVLRQLWDWSFRSSTRIRSVRWAIALSILVALAPARHYVRHAWSFYVPEPAYQQRVEYRITDWIYRNSPNARSFVTGTVRFWFDTWHDLAQVGGGSEQGILNQSSMLAQWDVRAAPDARASVLWLQAFGSDLIYVNEKQSEEPYHDYPFPEKFSGVLPVAFDDGNGNRIYRVPRRYPGIGRVVRRAGILALRPARNPSDLENLQPYANALEKGPDTPAEVVWEGTDALKVHSRFSDGDWLLLQVAYDPNWRAEANGRLLATRKDAFGQMLVETPPGDYEIRMTFPVPFENRVGWVITVLSGIVILILVISGYRPARN